ncbi:MAG: restriction endonuclease subunit S [Bacteroidota bacterium]
MRKEYKRLGNYIQPVVGRNGELGELPLVGLSIAKKFIPSIANTIGTDMSTYRIIEKNQFAYGPVTSRNGDKITIALFNDYEKALISQAYIPFEVKNSNELDPEFLMMWFRRPEFDRYARFKSHGSAREIFDWEEMCNTLLPVPSITKQREIVKEYNVVQNRIVLNQQLIQKLEETAQAVYKRWFVEFEFPDEEGMPYKSNGGEMVWCKQVEKEVPMGWGMDKLKNICTKIGSGSTPTGGKESYSSSGIALIRSTNVFDFNFSFEDLAFIYDEQADKLKNVEVRENDILFNITGVSVARCSMVPKNVLPARVNQHVMIIRPFKDLNISFFLLLNLCSTDSKNALLGISQSGSTREAITKAEIEDFEILLPKEVVLLKFESLMKRNFILKDMISKENQKLSELKGLLLSKLATIEN